MRVSNVAIYTLAALATSDLSSKANATSGLRLPLQEPEISNFLIDNPTTVRPEKAQGATASHYAIATALRESAPIAPPETLEVRSFAKVAAEAQNSQDRQQSDRVVAEAVRASTLPTNIFTPYLDRIRTSLPTGWVMRLPSQILLNDLHYTAANTAGLRDLKTQPSQYTVEVSPSSSHPGLTVNLFSCAEKLQSCLVGSFAVAAKTSIDVREEFKNYQTVATPITLANNIQGYLLEGSKQELTSEMSSVMWEQDNQFYTVKVPVQQRQNLLNIADSMAQAMPIQSLSAVPDDPLANPTAQMVVKKNQELTTGILDSRHPVLTTAEQLRQGEVVTNLRYRQSFPPGSDSQTGLTGQPTFGASWGVTNNLEIGLDAQTVDNSGPVRQGAFNAQRINPDGTGPNFFQEFTLQGKYRLWQNETGTQALSGVVAASLGNAGRPYRFFDKTGAIASGQNNGVVTSLELPFTIRTSDRLQFTLSPKVAFLPEDNALYFNRPPINDPGSFGTTFGLAGGVSYRLNPRLLLWGDAFVPLTGNNTINRDTGLPARTVAFNAGLRYLVNPRLATDLFVSNTLGNIGPLSIVADKDYPSLGVGITYLPGITGANRRYPQHFGSTQQPPPDTPAGFALLDGGTIANQQVRLSLGGGSQGLLTGIQYGLLDDLEIGTFLNAIPGTVDESELGFSGKIRLLHQADGDPFTLSTAVTLARANNVLVNLINNNRNEFKELGLEKSGFNFSNEKNGELFIITLSTPMQYQFKGGSAVWFTPTLGFIQRNGLQMAGFNLGGSVPLTKDLEAIAEAGYDLSGKGNAFIGNKRATVIPWSVGLRWRPASLLGIPEKSAIANMQLEAYVTNRVGSTPFESLRVRADNDTAIGVGLVLPIQF
jgi:hypothetical protein